jgi:ubiquinone/menaquinone biosynthesis C-methylase UbiE
MASSPHDAEIHDATILDQFTRQADPFAQRHGYSKDVLLDLMADCAAVSPEHNVLDVACGPGIVSCSFAKRAHHVTGLDFVPAMLDRARRYQAEQCVSNVTWQLGSATDLPFADRTFDGVITRFSFHHFLEPLAALREMKRVAKPGGIVLVCDVAPSREVQSAFNHWEILRDPSHTRALTLAEFEALGASAELVLRRKEHYAFDRDLEDLLAGSFPAPGDADRIRALFEADIRAATNTLGVAARRENDAIRLTYPLVVLAWQSPA